jgi:hypothetical protein
MKDEHLESLDLEIINAVAADNINDISASLMDVSISSLLQGGVFEDFPIVGVAFKSIKALSVINGQLNARKIARFLFQLQDIPLEERQNFIHNLDKESEVKKLGEQVIVLLNKLDDMEKADLLGFLFRCLVLERITRDNSRRYAML